VTDFSRKPKWRRSPKKVSIFEVVQICSRFKADATQPSRFFRFGAAAVQLLLKETAY